MDEQIRSAISGKTGHKSEFICCHETGQPLLVAEAEQCEVTGKYVKPGILELCTISRKRVLPSELEKCAATGNIALKKYLVTSSLTGARILEEVAARSTIGKYCAPVETKLCLWSGRKVHPDDLRVCELTGLPIQLEYVTGAPPRLQLLVDLLNGIRRNTEEPQLWDLVTAKVAAAIGKGRCGVESAILSPDRKHLAVCAEIRTLLGFRVRQAGLVYTVGEQSISGRVVQGQRTSAGWSEVNR